MDDVMTASIEESGGSGREISFYLCGAWLSLFKSTENAEFYLLGISFFSFMDEDVKALE